MRAEMLSKKQFNMRNLSIFLGQKENGTLFFEVIQNKVSKKQRNLLKITALSFPELLENINKKAEKIIALRIHKSATFYNGWRDSQTGKFKVKRTKNPLTKEEFNEAKNLIKFFLKGDMVA